MFFKKNYYKIVACYKQYVTVEKILALLSGALVLVLSLIIGYLLVIQCLPGVISEITALLIQEGAVLNPALTLPDAAVSSSDLQTDLPPTKVPDHPILPEAIPQDEDHIHKNVRREGDIEIYNDS